ncbi:TPM domain-containing protein [Lactococcus raffinolactis]|uniref:TPM domain-containing protein n=1 Tax=Pseudolactococcus raffinolactis TaxID=1366 RepID=UPI00241610A8|nr:TPM domain-containing protein [Lactococcus raffinolactis]MDG4962015.1 TPM domain-containing protein [Lactococcus raffinolactis]
MKKILVLLTLFVASFSVTVAHAEANYVKDDAKVLSQSQVQNLNEMLNELATSQTKSGESVHLEYAILTVKSLNRDDIEDYARDIFNKKQIGDSQHNLGVLFVIAIKDHEYRIQLGDGWNKTKYVNEKHIKKWVYTDNVTTMLRSDNYGEAIETITENMIALLGQDVVLPQSQEAFAKSLGVRIVKSELADVKRLKILKTFGIGSVIALLGGAISFFSVSSWRKFAKKRYLKKHRALVLSILELELGFYAEKERLSISDESLADAFNETKLPPTIENVQMFLDNFKWHDALIKQGDAQYKEDRKPREQEEMALRITKKKPSRRYHDFNDMNDNFRHDRFWRGYYYGTLLYPVAAPQTAFADHDNSDSNSGNDTWTGFGGGGGFSSGGGASGGW